MLYLMMYTQPNITLHSERSWKPLSVQNLTPSCSVFVTNSSVVPTPAMFLALCTLEPVNIWRLGPIKVVLELEIWRQALYLSG